MQVRTKLGMAGIGAAALGGALLASPEHTHADGELIWGTLNTGGHLVQYSTYRTHVSGPSSLDIIDNTGFGALRYSRFGLRDLADVQITNTNQYNGDGGYMPFTKAGTTNTTIPGGDYAINGRMADCFLCDNYWVGYLII